MTVNDLHKEAMRFQELAIKARKNELQEESLRNFAKAFEFEKQAFILFNSQSQEEPTRSILLKSVATMALQANLYRDAEKYVCMGLAGDPTADIAEELRDLLQQANFSNHLLHTGHKLLVDELQLSLAGSEVGNGLIKGNELMNRIAIIEKIAYRTSDRLLQKPFNEKGKPNKASISHLEPYLAPAKTAGFAVIIKFGQPIPQQSFEGMDVQSNIINELLTNLQLINEKNYDQLTTNIPDDAYRRNFIALAKQLAPDGQRITQVGFTTTRAEKNHSISLTKVKEEIHIELEPKSEQHSINSTAEKVEITGMLSFADSKKSVIKLTDANNVDFLIDVPMGLLSDIVKPYFEESVLIRGTHNGKKIELEEIESYSQHKEG